MGLVVGPHGFIIPRDARLFCALRRNPQVLRQLERHPLAIETDVHLVRFLHAVKGAVVDIGRFYLGHDLHVVGDIRGLYVDYSRRTFVGRNRLRLTGRIGT